MLPYLRRHRRRLWIGLSLVPVFTIIQLAIPLVVREALGRLESLSRGGGGEAAIDGDWWRRTCLLLAGLWFAYGAVRLLARYLVIGLSRIVEEELRRDLFRHLAHLPAAFFDKARIGDLIARATQDVELLRFLAGPTLFFGLSTAILLPMTLAVLLHLSVLLGIVVVVLYSSIMLAMMRIFPRLGEQSRAVQDAQGEIAAKAQEDFTGIRVLHAFGKEAAETEAFSAVARTGLEAQVDMAETRGRLHALFVASSGAGLLSLMAVGVWTGMPANDVFAAMLYVLQLSWPLMIIGWILQTWHRARAAADRLDEVFEVEPEDPARGAVRLAAPHGPALEARRLTFRYPGSTRPALADVSFRLPENGTLGLVGPIGSGKTTLVSLLTRLYDPPAGSLFISGIDVLELPLSNLRAQIAVAPQEPFLFSDTLKNNILFGTGEATGSLDSVLERARLSGDLETFPEGLEQIIGERGVTLSGGQKQRTSLARALAPDRPILVLDDTLSAVDHATERHILGELHKEEGRRTRILIAHRLEAVRKADLILVLDQGRVVEQGRHEELLRRGGWYASTWRRQQEEGA